MRLRTRFNKLTLWNKLAAIGAIASIASIPLAIVLVILQSLYTSQRNPDRFGPIGDSVDGPQAEITTTSGLKYKDLPRQTPKPGQIVTVHYSGRLSNGTKLDSSTDRGEPFTFRIGVGEVVEGWDEGIMRMKVGDKREFTIPPHLFYGPKGIRGIIPDNATAIYEVELLSIK